MKIIDEIVDRVITGLENGTVPWRKTWKDGTPSMPLQKGNTGGLTSFFSHLPVLKTIIPTHYSERTGKYPKQEDM
jgi:hypothetical protein